MKDVILVDESQAVKKPKKRRKRKDANAPAALDAPEKGLDTDLQQIEEELKNEIAVRNVKRELDDLIEKVYKYCLAQSGMQLYPYQEPFAKRIIESVLKNDGDEITALFSRQCIPEGTVIHTREGHLVRIEDHPNAWKTQENAEIIEIRARGGAVIRCTKNHPIMTKGGWVPAGLLREGDEIAVLESWDKFGDGVVPYAYDKYVNMHRTDHHEGNFEMNEELAELVGWLTADGSMRPGQSVKFTNNNRDYLNRVASLVRKYFPDVDVKWYEKGKGYDLIFSTTGNHSGQNSLKDFIRIMDYDASGFPKAVNYFTKEQVAAFFRGMFASDGYVNQKDEKNIDLGLACGNDRTYAEFCRELLNKLGVRGQVKGEKMKKGTSTFYRVVICGQRNLRLFKETIGEIPGKPIPDMNYTRENNVETFTEIDGEYLMFRRIVSIRLAGTADVWDVEYPEKGWFICGGVMAHNSGKTETVAVVISGLMVILPILANLMPENENLQQFKDGVWVGIFAPSKEQAHTAFSRVKQRLTSKNAKLVMTDPEISVDFESERGNPMVLTNGSLCRMQTAAKQSQIESKTYHIIWIDECQDVDDTKLLKCLAGDTRILMGDGRYETIKNVVENHLTDVVRFNKDFTELVVDEPLEFYDNGIQPVYEIRLNNGDTIKATGNHQFYIYRKSWRKSEACRWVTVDEMMKLMNTHDGVRMAVPDYGLPFKEKGGKDDYRDGLIIGYFLGDGCLTGGSPLFIGTDKTTKRLEKLIQDKFPNVKMTKYHQQPSGMIEVAFVTDGNKKGSNPLKEWFKEIGIWGRKGIDKFIPMYNQTENYYKGIIEGLIETDGCIESPHTKPIISFANISETMITQLKDILLRFGIHATRFVKDNGEINGYPSKELHLLHIKSVLDIQRFSKSFSLYEKEDKLMVARNTILDKKSRNKAKHYPDGLRFYKVTSIKPAGEEHTYCLKMNDRNFIANNMVSSNSIHPMGAATNATLIKIGTPNTKKSSFYNTIRRNIRAQQNYGAVQNHFQFDYKIVQKYNPRYKKYIEKEIERLGYDSDEFRMAYRLHFILERGMFVTEDVLRDCYDEKLKLKESSALPCAAGIDIGKSQDSTVVTILELDWDNAYVNEKTGQVYPLKRLIGWLELKGDDHEVQFFQILDFLRNYNLKSLFIDSTGKGDSVADRFVYALPDVHVEPYPFSRPSKSEMWKALHREILGRRILIPYHSRTRRLRTFRRFESQMLDLEKDYVGGYMVCKHPDVKGAHDDYPDSLGLANLAAEAEFMPEVEVTDNIFF